MNIWISSDFHFGHTNIAGEKVSKWKEGYRDFDSVHEMNKTLTSTINKYVKKDDILWFLGDFGFGGHTNIPSYRHSLQVETIHLIRGNHDGHIDKYADLFTTIQDKYIGPLGNRYFTLDHYAHRVWMGSHKGHLHCYGHSHGSLEQTPWGKSMDVGVDNAYRITGEYRPFHIDEVVSILNKREIAFVDHHSSETNVR